MKPLPNYNYVVLLLLALCFDLNFAFRSLNRKVLLTPLSCKKFVSVDSRLSYKFGIISDIQYVDAADSLNFQQSKLRKYRQSLRIYRDAVNSWLKHGDIMFSLVLGLLLRLFLRPLKIFLCYRRYNRREKY